MKTNQKLEIIFDGLVFVQDMHLKMIYKITGVRENNWGQGQGKVKFVMFLGKE